jgi:hypothetical protein
MKKQIPASFEDLVKAHYGDSGQIDRSNTTKVKALLSNYYGQIDGDQQLPTYGQIDGNCQLPTYGQPHGESSSSKGKKSASAILLSLSYDDGEILTQPSSGQQNSDRWASERPFEEYVVQQSIVDADFEEYVVEKESLAQASSTSYQQTDEMPVREASTLEEYQVDLFQPWKAPIDLEVRGIASAPSPTGNPSNTNDPAAAGYPAPQTTSVKADQPNSSVPATQSLSAHQNGKQTEVTEDDLIADLQSILSGQKVFDPVSKQTIGKDDLDQPRSELGQPAVTQQPSSNASSNNALPFPEASNSQAIFDRIAQSMQYANAYDLGTVELENRFSDFDRMHELEQKAAAEKKAKRSQKPVEPSVIKAPEIGTAMSNTLLDATVMSGDFIQDLDAIHHQWATSAATAQTHPTLYSLSASTPDKWDRIAKDVFNYANYEDYLANALQSTNFFGQALNNLYSDMIQKLVTAQAELQTSQGSNYQAPLADSTLRKKKSMHGWGMAIDFKVMTNPYVLNEAGEGQLDQALLQAYDHIAAFVLGKSQSDLRKLRQGRSAFGDGSISAVYDSLREESDAMKRYFSWLDDEAGLRSFTEQEWTLSHSGQPAPQIEQIKAQIKDDYEVLGGATDAGNKRPTNDQSDRPFAPTSSGGKGDPKTGFLNLDKAFVLAMTNAGLAWGAIDFGGASGDVQHFDLRLEGNGKKVYSLLLQYKS